MKTLRNPVTGDADNGEKVNSLYSIETLLKEIHAQQTRLTEHDI